MTMNPSTFPVVRFSPNSKPPTRGSKKSAGLDLYSIDEVTIPPWSRTLVDMGIGAGVPTRTYGRITPRSGLAIKSSINIGAGVIDADYTGAIKVLMINNSETPFQVTVGMWVAQLILEKVETLEPRDSSILETTGRDNKGFGSTGISIITPEIVQQIPAEYHDFLDIFDPDLPSIQLPPHRPQYNLALKLDPNKPLPKPARPYHMNTNERKDWEKWWDTMVNAGFISKAPPNTLVAAPFFFIWKKDGTQRPVINYRKINDITIKDGFPLPRIDEMLERMQGSKIFSKFNLKNGYHQLRIKSGDEWKVTFMTPDGPYMPHMMTFGLCNAPPYFQRWMSDVLAPVLNQNVECYLDDAGSHHDSQGKHISVNCQLLQCFRDHGIFANAKKCEFHKDHMSFLGVDVSEEGFEMEVDKVAVIQEWQPPKNMRAVREFMGFCNFY